MKTITFLTLLLTASVSFAEFKVGNSVYATSGPRAYTEGRILEIDSNGMFTLKFIADDAVGGNWGPNDIASVKGCSADLCVGSTVYPISEGRAGTSAIVVGIESNGNYILEFNSDLAVGGGWGRGGLAAARGCVEGLCVGKTVVATNGERAWTSAVIIAIDPSGLFTLKFTADDAVGSGWGRASLAATEGCIEDLCVGETVLPTEVTRIGTLSTVIAVESSGTYVLKFEEDQAVGGNWGRSILAKGTGCSGSGICIGQSVTATSGGRVGTTATILGFDPNEKYILKFDSDGAVGAGWAQNDFTLN